jgi:hypothetical protein
MVNHYLKPEADCLGGVSQPSPNSGQKVNEKNGGEKMKKKTDKTVFATVLLHIIALSLICSPAIIAVVGANISSSDDKPWTIPKDFVNPVELKIAEFRAKDITDEQITEELEKLRMGWDPKSGATAMLGDELSPEEQKVPSSKSPPVGSGSRIDTQANVVFYTPDDDISYTGIGNNMYPGTMPIDDDETWTHYITTHFRKDDGETEYWTEVGLQAWNSSSYIKYFTYDNDEYINGERFVNHGIKSTSVYTSDLYCIVMNGTYDSSFGGYWYNIYINNVFKRSGHLKYLLNRADVANEIFSDTGVYTEDTGCKFHDNYLSDDEYEWINWNDDIEYDLVEFPAYMDWGEFIDENRYDFISYTL